jgi:hypothetical protein
VYLISMVISFSFFSPHLIIIGIVGGLHKVVTLSASKGTVVGESFKHHLNS